ncbi:hypothetical protein ACFQ5D_02610 [Paenibacillus farraposensis]|uniref:Uncharacterized protein n=1 Tax=Paenibacillus farraposensis TaxID=2807095 RepID=A0ABW4D8S9_9BACL|nr:hypothetical protein [Paenibacillus farraposensis]MCC3381788.1 hypothetical protein [Paenibacillus farraposensis]
MIDYLMKKNTGKLVRIQYDISIRFSILASAILKGCLMHFQQFNGNFPALGQVIEHERS